MSNESQDKIILEDEDDKYLEENRAHSSENEDEIKQKENKVVDKEIPKNSSHFQGFGSKPDNTEKIEINEKNVREEKNNNTFNENEIVNNNSYFKPSNMSMK